MKRLIEAYYDEMANVIYFSLLIGEETYQFSAEVRKAIIQDEEKSELTVFRYEPDLGSIVPLSDQNVWRFLHFCLSIIMKSGRELEVPVDFDDPDDPGARAIWDIYGEYK